MITTLRPASRTLPGETQERRQRGAEGRLLGQLDGAGQKLGDVGCVDDDAAERAPEILDEAILVLTLVEAWVPEADAERVERLGIQAASQRGGR